MTTDDSSRWQWRWVEVNDSLTEVFYSNRDRLDSSVKDWFATPSVEAGSHAAELLNDLEARAAERDYWEDAAETRREMYEHRYRELKQAEAERDAAVQERAKMSEDCNAWSIDYNEMRMRAEAAERQLQEAQMERNHADDIRIAYKLREAELRRALAENIPHCETCDAPAAWTRWHGDWRCEQHKLPRDVCDAETQVFVSLCTLDATEVKGD